MKDFTALIRDSLAIKNPPNTWQHGKNMVLTKGATSVSNEEGFKFEYLIKGVVIGIISTNESIVYFSKNADGTDEIGVVNDNNDAPVYNTVVKANLNFQYNCPIEGVFIYNFKEELIVGWVDGVKVNSNPPKVLNLSTLPFDTNPDGTLVNPSDLNLIDLNPSKQQGNLDVGYIPNGTLNGFTIYITFAYVYNDDTRTSYFSSSDIGYLGIGIDPTEAKGLRLTFTDLDTSFSKLKIGLVLKTEGTESTASVLQGYESDILEYTGNSLVVDVDSLNNYTETTPEELLIETSTFTKVNTITKYQNQAIIGNVETGKTDIGFQPYANLIEVLPFEYYENTYNGTETERIENREQNASLLPDEVYALYIQLQKLDGSYTDAYHIPGRAKEGTETDSLTDTQLSTYDLTELNSEHTFKQFHVFNNGFAATADPDYLDGVAVDESNNKMGYWENLEVYPDEDNYNSSELGGEDLRNTPIRYHRMPSLRSMVQQDTQTYTFNGETVTTPTRDGVARTALNSVQYPAKKYGIKLTNIASIIPASILSQIQGYRILHVKRDNSNNYVAGNWIGVKRKDVDDGRTQVSSDGFYEHYDFGYYPNDTNHIDFQRIRVLGNELFRFRPTISPIYVQTNYIFHFKELTGSGGINVAGASENPYVNSTESERFSKCYSPLTYRLGNNFGINTEYHEEGINLDLKPSYISRRIEDYQYPIGSAFDPPRDIQYLVLNLTAYTHKLNVYQGFSSDDLNIIGRTGTISNNTKLRGGDNFTRSRADIHLRSRQWIVNPEYTNGSSAYIQRRRSLHFFIQNLNSPINVSQLYNNTPVNRDTTDPAVLATNDYDFDVRGKGSISGLHDVTTNFTFDVNSDFINRFPFRIYRGITTPNESLTAKALSTFKVDDYYEMPNDKGEIIALRGREDTLFIQHRFALFAARVKDKLKTSGEDTYLGISDLFDRIPQELLSDSKGYIGTTSKFASTVIKDMYITVNQITGQIFIVKEGVSEITNKGNKRWFWENWDNGLNFYDISYTGEKRRIDNPYASVGHIVGYDKEYNRLLFTKKMYNLVDPDLLLNLEYTTDGEFYFYKGDLIDFGNTEIFEEISRTLSFNLETQTWAFEHDYFPNMMFHTTHNLHSLRTTLQGTDRSSVYEHNDKSVKGLYYGEKFDSYIDLIFNQRLDVTKLYKTIRWVSSVINSEKGTELHKTITHIMVYNEHQCSGIINLKDNNFDLTRQAEGEWSFNAFRDLVVDSNLPIITNSGEVIDSNINNNKIWFDKSNFISKFITVRLIYDNIDNNDLHLHQVNVESIISKR